MLVVISMIGLIAGITLPSIVRLFGAGAEEQAYNVIAAQLMAARALAIREGTYAGVAIQRADATDELWDRCICYSAVMIFNRMGDRDQDGTTNAIFELAPGFEPRKMPGHIGFVDGDELERVGTYDDDQELYTFFGHMTYHSGYAMYVVFSPDGKLVRYVNDKKVGLGLDCPLFLGPGESFEDKPDAVWESNRCGKGNEQYEIGCTTLVMVDLVLLERVGGGVDRAEFLNETGVFLPINMHTGQLFPRR
jgi:hypothetical protein